MYTHYINLIRNTTLYERYIQPHTRTQIQGRSNHAVRGVDPAGRRTKEKVCFRCARVYDTIHYYYYAYNREHTLVLTPKCQCVCVWKESTGVHGLQRPPRSTAVNRSVGFQWYISRSSVVLGFTDVIIVSIDCLIILSPVERRRLKNYGQPKAKTIYSTNDFFDFFFS